MLPKLGAIRNLLSVVQTDVRYQLISDWPTARRQDNNLVPYRKTKGSCNNDIETCVFFIE